MARGGVTALASSRQAGPTPATLTQALLHRLGRAIVIGGYDDCPFPNEAELAAQHGTSRSITREAVKMLAAKGLVQGRPRIGTQVQPVAAWNLFDGDVLGWLLERRFSLDLLRQFTELRLAVEPGAAALAATAADAPGRAAIAAGYARMQAAAAAAGMGAADEPLAADIAFHVAILRATANPFFAQLQDMVATALRVSIRFTNTMHGRTANLDEHEAVLAAIQAGDADAAATAMRALIGGVLTLIGQAA